MPDGEQRGVAPDLSLEGREVSVAFPDLTLAYLEGAVDAMRRHGVPVHAPLTLNALPDGVTQFVYKERADMAECLRGAP